MGGVPVAVAAGVIIAMETARQVPAITFSLFVWENLEHQWAASLTRTKETAGEWTLAGLHLFVIAYPLAAMSLGVQTQWFIPDSQ